MSVTAALLGVLVAAAPAEAVIRASGELRRISTTRYEFVVRNTGDESFNQFFFRPLPGVQALAPSSPDARCTSTVEGFHCDLFALAPGARRTVDFRTEAAYPTNGGGIVFPGQAGPVFGTGFPVRGPSEGTLRRPVLGTSQRVRPVRGVVLVRRRGSRRFVRLHGGRLLPDRSEIDTRRGTAQITVASDRRGGRATATVSDGRAIIDQDRARRPTTTLALSEPLACARGLATASSRAPRPSERTLFVRTSGRRKRAAFRTRGNHAAATSSGTAWRTTDTCSTTTIRVTEGTVRVRDFRRQITFALSAPRSYTARRR